jgi:hypothetical protein
VDVVKPQRRRPGAREVARHQPDADQARLAGAGGRPLTRRDEVDLRPIERVPDRLRHAGDRVQDLEFGLHREGVGGHRGRDHRLAVLEPELDAGGEATDARARATDRWRIRVGHVYENLQLGGVGGAQTVDAQRHRVAAR